MELGWLLGALFSFPSHLRPPAHPPPHPDPQHNPAGCACLGSRGQGAPQMRLPGGTIFRCPTPRPYTDGVNEVSTDRCQIPPKVPVTPRLAPAPTGAARHAPTAFGHGGLSMRPGALARAPARGAAEDDQRRREDKVMALEFHRASILAAARVRGQRAAPGPDDSPPTPPQPIPLEAARPGRPDAQPSACPAPSGPGGVPRRSYNLAAWSEPPASAPGEKHPPV
ncbi:hypothetical protein PAPYR_13340 [Paratrimastix pyriformis]|uniref:Uncharacterized protein n=1 Tax=Paratrimastix pyriformis TaxID=342808 RepID=A0ABQ8U0D8_9EUKA|nr:hypothetical protein PAPYR_13340 [Paratrimastix pyriformis]